MYNTSFSDIYRRFKAKITDDMYMELTPIETDRLLKELLLNSLHNFEFPRVNIYDYNEELEEYNIKLTPEEQNIIATYMIVEWLSQQLASVENTRMKYSGSDFKFTSQANHMAKIQAMKKDYERRGFHLQRLYKRRIADSNGVMRSTFGSIMSELEDLKSYTPQNPSEDDSLSKDEFLELFDKNKNEIIDESDTAYSVYLTDF